jgi:hypothetical protein
LKIEILEVEHYTIVIEQNVESVPEFSSMVLVLVFATGIAAAMILVRRQRYLRGRSQL